MFFEHVICKRGVPDIITTGHIKEFTGQFWDRVCSYLGINHRLSIPFHQQTEEQLSSGIKRWSSTSKPFATTSRTTGSNGNHMRNLGTATPATIPRWWHPSGRTTITTLRCSSTLPRTTVSDHRCMQTRGYQAWQRLPEFSGKTF